jgi:hypothetical protein
MASERDPRVVEASSREELEAKARERAEELARTIEIHGRYDWGDDLLEIDPDDILVDRPETPEHEGFPAHPTLLRVDFERFVDEAYVGRVLERGDALLEGEMALDRRQELRDCLEIVEDLATPPHVVGFHVAVLSRAARKAKEERARREAAGETSDAPAARARRAIERILAGDGGGEDADAAVEELRGLGEEAGWAVMGRLHFEEMSPAARRRLLEVAVDTDEPLAVTLVLHEAVRAFEGDEGGGAEQGLALARLLARRDDQRAIPLMAFLLKSERLGGEARDALVKTLQEVGIWGEVSRVLASFKGHWPLVAPAGVDFEQFAGRVAELEGVDAKDQDAVEAFLEKARAHWDETYREDLGYLRTKDADRAGPIEIDLMQRFTGEAAHLVQDVPDQKRIQRQVENFREEWMRTPQRSIGGRRPLAAILEERIGLHPSEMGRRRARRTILARMVREARHHLAEKRLRRARATLDVLHEMSPDHPPARRLRAELANA